MTSIPLGCPESPGRYRSDACRPAGAGPSRGRSQVRAPCAPGTPAPWRTRLPAAIPEANSRIHPGLAFVVDGAARVPPKTFLIC